MGDYLFRVMNAFVGSEIVPAFARRRIMQVTGFGMSDTATVWAGCSFRSKKVSIGSQVFINVGFYHDGHDWLRIGSNIKIGPYVRIITASHDIGPTGQRGSVEVVGMPVIISDGCWIGASVTILPGVTIAPGCVIGAGSVVRRSTEPNGVYAGIPAKRIKDLEA